MKTRVYIIAILSMLSIAGYAVTYTPAQEWKSTSPMMMSGSAYTSQVTEVGAEYAASAATTTETYSPNKAPSGPRREKILGPQDDPANQFPIGDAVLPLTLMAVAFAGVIALRRKRKAKQYD
ncbi:MAG: hypothetical protein IJ920_00440 [Paludibacteraceae bacterium]|nr:hypothetical protein [Paludibacteraceae bacterium]